MYIFLTKYLYFVILENGTYYNYYNLSSFTYIIAIVLDLNISLKFIQKLS